MQRRSFFKFSAAAVGSVAVGSAFASGGHEAAKSAGELQEIAKKMFAEAMKTNEAYSKMKGDGFFEAFKGSQHPRATVVGCSDSRFQAGSLDASPENDLFVIRNIGNQFSSNEGSVSYGVRHLNTPLLFIVGHTRCGAIKAALSDYSEESSAIRKEVDYLSLSVRRAVLKGSADEQWMQAVASNVNQQVEYCMQEFSEEAKSGKLTMVGMIYDLANDLKKGYGRMHVININGEKDPQKLSQMPLIKAVSK